MDVLFALSIFAGFVAGLLVGRARGERERLEVFARAMLAQRPAEINAHKKDLAREQIMQKRREDLKKRRKPLPESRR